MRSTKSSHLGLYICAQTKKVMEEPVRSVVCVCSLKNSPTHITNSAAVLSPGWNVYSYCIPVCVCILLECLQCVSPSLSSCSGVWASVQAGEIAPERTTRAQKVQRRYMFACYSLNVTMLLIAMYQTTSTCRYTESISSVCATAMASKYKLK